MKGHFFSFSRLIDSSVWGSNPCMMSTTRMAMSHSELPRFLKLLNVKTKRKSWETDRQVWEKTVSKDCGTSWILPKHKEERNIFDFSRQRLFERYLKDSCPGVSMISMPGILRFSLSNCSKDKRLNQWSCARCLYTGVSSYILNHLCLLHNRLSWNVCGSDLLRDPSSLAILNMSVSQLLTQKQENDNRIRKSVRHNMISHCKQSQQTGKTNYLSTNLWRRKATVSEEQILLIRC